MRLPKIPSSAHLIRGACALCLVSLATTSWAVLDPRPLVVIFAMSAGQGAGILGVMLYLIVVVRDVWPRLRRRQETKQE